jgi:hypothetical protein
MPVYESNRRHIPDDLKPYDHWVLWGVDGKGRKRPLAPWVRGDLYPVKWGSEAPERPETSFETAMEHYRRRECYSTPDGIDSSEVKPAPLLLHEPLDPPLMQVDFDDVRDPETGTVTAETADIVSRLDAYTEISQSGEGLHVFVRAELPGGLGKFIAPLIGEGDIELYDHGRAVGATWEQVSETPDAVPERQQIVDEIVSDYETSSQRERRLGTKPDIPNRGQPETKFNSDDPAGGDDENNRSPYFDIPIRSVADTGWFQRHGDGIEGPHPGHGPIHSDPDKCTNFGVDHTHDCWFCFAHDSGGRAIELAAVLSDHTDVDCPDVPDKAASESWLTNQPKTLLRTCIELRDQGVVEEGARPPYAALLAVAEHEDLHIRDAEAGVLGEANAKIAEKIYFGLELEDL